MLCVAVRRSAFQRVTALCRRCSAAVCVLLCVAVLFTHVCIFHVSYIHSKVTFMRHVTNARESRTTYYEVTRQELTQQIAPLHFFAIVCNNLQIQHSESEDSKTHVLRIPKFKINLSWFISHAVVRVNFTCWGMPHKIGSCHTCMSHVTREAVTCHLGDSIKSSAIIKHQQLPLCISLFGFFVTSMLESLFLHLDKYARKPISPSWQLSSETYFPLVTSVSGSLFLHRDNYVRKHIYPWWQVCQKHLVPLCDKYGREPAPPSWQVCVHIPLRPRRDEYKYGLFDHV